MRNVIVSKSKVFAVRIVRLYQYLCTEKREYVLSKQLLRSGTSIGANIHEAQFGQSKADFIAKMYIALKEASETEYWLEILRDTDYMTNEEFKSIVSDCKEIIALLTSIIKSSK
ncbi:MAG: four helix bundle protein [Oscillospiraceae bacterium]|jgi:four helix bundle protein|nr:four helix bundle protein [Oscillospiraceae bacterium]